MTESAPSDNIARTSSGYRYRLSPRSRIFAGVVFVAVVAIGCYYIGRDAGRQEANRRLVADKAAQLPVLQGQLADALQNQIKSIDGQLQAVSKQQPPQGQSAQINNLQAQIGNIQANLSALQNQLGSLQKQLNQLAPAKQSAIDALTAQLKAAQDKIREMMPSYPNTPNTYNIKSNQSVIVEGGRLQIGLVGSPGQDRVVLNLNGAHQSVAVGDIINAAIDPSTNCRISIISIEFLKAAAVVKTTCVNTKS